MSQIYRLDANAADTAVAMNAQAGRDPWQGDYLTPGKFAPIITKHQKSGQRVMRPMHWGYPPPGWNAESANVTGEAPRWVSHVRNLESPFWIGNLRHSELRCLIPATAFQIWSQYSDPRTGKKSAYWLAPDQAAEDGVFAIAGIWRDLTDLPVFAMLTVDAVGKAAQINDQAAMPVILQPQDYDRWLTADWKSEARHLVQPYAGDLSQASPTR